MFYYIAYCIHVKIRHTVLDLPSAPAFMRALAFFYVRTRLYSACARYGTARARFVFSVPNLFSTAPAAQTSAPGVHMLVYAELLSTLADFESAPDAVLSTHSNIMSTPALMHLYPRFCARQQPHAFGGL
jgi:hypothetical protein